MFRIKSFQFVVVIFLLGGVIGVAAQQRPDDWPGMPDARGRRNNDDDRVLNEMLSKQRSAKEKKDYEELVERAEKALTLSEELGKAIEKDEHLIAADQKKLVELEKLAVKIRSDLGGSDDDANAEVTKKEEPLTLKESFKILRESTAKMADEIKKSTRYSISVVAIESSNAVIRIARFLRLKN